MVGRPRPASGAPGRKELERKAESPRKPSGPGEAQPFLLPAPVDSHTGLPASLRPEFVLRPAPSAHIKDSAVRDGPGGGRAGVGRHPPKPASRRQPPQTACFLSVLAPVLSRRGHAVPPSGQGLLLVSPGHPVCRLQPLWGQLKDPWHGRSARLPTRAPGGSWQSVSVLRLLRTSSHCV